MNNPEKNSNSNHDIKMAKSTEKLLRITLMKLMLKDYAIAILTDNKEAVDAHFNGIIQELYLILEEKD